MPTGDALKFGPGLEELRLSPLGCHELDSHRQPAAAEAARDGHRREMGQTPRIRQADEFARRIERFRFVDARRENADRRRHDYVDLLEDRSHRLLEEVHALKRQREVDSGNFTPLQAVSTSSPSSRTAAPVHGARPLSLRMIVVQAALTSSTSGWRFDQSSSAPGRHRVRRA